jgi:hypothetical protein
MKGIFQMKNDPISNAARELAVMIIFKETSSDADFNLTYDDLDHRRDDADKIAGIAQLYFDAVRKAALEEAADLISHGNSQCDWTNYAKDRIRNAARIRALIDQPAAATQVSDDKDAEIKRLREALEEAAHTILIAILLSNLHINLTENDYEIRDQITLDNEHDLYRRNRRQV